MQKFIIYFIVLTHFSNAFAVSLDDYYAKQRELELLNLNINETRGSDPLGVSRLIYADMFTQRTRLSSEIEEMQRTLELNAMSTNLELLQNNSQYLTRPNVMGQSCCTPDTLIPDEQVFQSWSTNFSQDARKSLYYGARDPNIAQCLVEQPEGSSMYVNKRIRYKCNESTPRYQYSNSRYRLSIENGMMTVRLNIFFDYEGDGDSEEAYQKLRDAMPCVRNFYARSGIRLIVNIEENENFISDWVRWSMSDHSVDLHNHIDRAYVSAWATDSASNPEMNYSNRCALYAHELGHMIGLGDRYPTDSCPDRVIGERDELMRGGSISRIENMRLTERDIRQIIKPLCGD